VDFLLSEIRKTPMEAPKELVEEVTYLAKRYGIITPYTSYLMADDLTLADPNSSVTAEEKLTSRALMLNGYGTFGGAGGRVAPTAPGADRPAESKSEAEAAKEAVIAAKKLSGLRRDGDKSGAATAFDSFADDELAQMGNEGRTSTLQALRYIGTLTFYNSGDVWYDSRYDAQKDKIEKTVKIGSDEYIDLLLKDGQLAKYLALGDVVLKVKDTWYRFEK
jgi:Ca-activated chloride channel family protein